MGTTLYLHEKHELTSFPDTRSTPRFYADSDQLHSVTVELPGEPDNDLFAKRYLYTISEDNSEDECSDTSPDLPPLHVEWGLMRAAGQSENLDTCGTDSDKESPTQQDEEKFTFFPGWTDKAREQTDDDQFTMLPERGKLGGQSFQPDHGRQSSVYLKLQNSQLFREVEIQAELQCQKCSELEEENRKLMELLKKAGNEIAYLNDEFSILQESLTEVGERKSLVEKEFDSADLKTAKNQSYIGWFISCALTIPKFLFKFWT